MMEAHSSLALLKEIKKTVRASVQVSFSLSPKLGSPLSRSLSLMMNLNCNWIASFHVTALGSDLFASQLNANLAIEDGIQFILELHGLRVLLECVANLLQFEVDSFNFHL